MTAAEQLVGCGIPDGTRDAGLIWVTYRALQRLMRNPVGWAVPEGYYVSFFGQNAKLHERLRRAVRRKKEAGLNLFGQKVWRMLWSIALIVVAGYVCLAIFLMVFQSHYVYFPERAIVMTPDTIGLSHEAVGFEAADGVRLSAWFVPAESPRGTLLFCHGNAGNISHRLESIEVFNRLGLNTFIFDYRGYGQSEGRITEQGTYLDGEAAWRYLVEEQHVDPADIIVFGRSLGGTIAAWIAKDHAPKALIIESTFTSIPDIGSDLYPYLPVRFLSRFNYNAVDYLRQVNCPVLIIHSRDDEIIPFSHGRRLFEAANEPKELLEIAGSHNEGFMISARRYQEGLDVFISRHASE